MPVAPSLAGEQPCRPGPRRLALVAAVLSLAAAPRGAAQDTQYWAIQNGPVGQLLKVTFLLGFVFGI